MPQYGGMESVLIAVPEILEYSISKETDFIVMGCDGIFDHVENKEIIEAVWMTMGACGKEDIHSQAAQAVDMVIKCSLARKSFDNVTAIMICFDGMERRLGAEIKKPESPRKIDDSQFSSSHVQSCRNRLYSGNLSLWNANETAKDEKNPNSTKNKHRNLFNSKTVLVKPAYHSNSKQINLRLPLKKDSAFNQPLSHLHKNSAYSQKSLEGQLTEKKT